MTQEMLDRLIGAAPPSTVDLDAVIRRTRRGQRMRRIAASGSAAVAVLAVAVAGVSLNGNEQRTVAVQSPPSPSPSPSPLPSSSPSPSVTAGQRLTPARLRAAVEEATAEQAPGTRWIYMPDVPGEKRDPDGHLKVWENKDPASFEGRSGVTRNGRKGGFYLSLRVAPLYECDGTVPVCEITTTADGLELVHYVDKPGNGWVFYGADVLLPDGKHALRMSAVNYFGGDGSPAVAPVPVFTRDELDRIAATVAADLSQ
ncbi:hypothetical protein Acy02nite_72470 [Actinoplanes cyaneus]|uniref:Uncharacterized protein n=1 Tax=Actinoplanes cyaneus TaxID=52696 RepID=A0A919MFM5_9ACTN|nr:hypothetical protein [Actinoplanes cyaneus]MCW2142346.1 hypothetical protein [Actinoplanes cyaneus]GID69366.1 hypothetical protein Acy02nite_72470 [Actinoplanes cyaneus]